MSSDEESISGEEATSDEEEVEQPVVIKKKRKAKKKVSFPSFTRLRAHSVSCTSSSVDLLLHDTLWLHYELK